MEGERGAKKKLYVSDRGDNVERNGRKGMKKGREIGK